MKKNLATPIFGITTIGEKGQIVIPADIRETLGLKKGEKLMIIGRQDGMGLIRPSQMAPFIQKLAQISGQATKRSSQFTKPRKRA